MPDIGHFIECMFNGFYAFKEKNSEFLGISLLDPNRIRATSSDVSRHLKFYNKIDKHNSKHEEMLVLKNTRLQRENPIVLHYCGDHSCCKASHYKHKSTELLEK